MKNRFMEVVEYSFYDEKAEKTCTMLLTPEQAKKVDFIISSDLETIKTLVA